MKLFFKIYSFLFFLISLSIVSLTLSASPSYAAVCNSTNYTGGVYCQGPIGSISGSRLCRNDGGTVVSGGTCSSSSSACCCPAGSTCSLRSASTPTPTTPPAGSCTNVTAICPDNSNSGTTWGVKIWYYINGSLFREGLTNTNGCFEISNYRGTSNDKIKWQTACVDPELNFVVDQDYAIATRACQKTGDPYNYFIMTPDVSCKSYDAASASTCFGKNCGLIYGACGGPNDYPSAGSSGSNSLYARNLGNVAFASLCPIPNDNPGRIGQGGENKFRCAYAGNTNSGVDFVGCRGTCNYRSCTSSGGYGVFTTNSNDSRCDNVSGCSATNTPTPAPPAAPVVTATATCNANDNPVIGLDWAAAARANSYDVDYKRSSASTWTVGANNTTNTAYNITGIVEGVNYDWRVRSVNGAGNSAYDTGTTQSRDCTVTPTNTRTPTPTATRTPTPAPSTADIDVNVFDDPNGNCSGNSRIGGSQVCLDGGTCQSTSASNPGAKFSNVAAGTHSINLTPRNNYVLSSCSSNPKSRTVPPDAVANYYIQDQPPVCTSLTTNRATVNPGQNATLTANGCPNGVDYIWYTPGPGSYPGNTPYSTGTTNTVTWRSPNPYSIDTYAYPTVQVCNSGGGSCTSYALSNGSATSNPPNQGIHIVPLYRISGNVYVDEDNDGVKDANENNYSGGITITRNPANGVVSYGTGTFDITGLSATTYTISYTSLPAGYQMTVPLNGPPPSFSVAVGPDASNINFGITNTTPWIQSEGSDVWFNSGFNNEIPAGASCGGAGAYSSIVGASGRPGIIFSGVGTQSHGGGQASANPYNWKVGGTGSDANSLPPPPPSLKTSYDYVNSKLSNYAGTPVDLPCPKTTTYNCSFTSLATGVYKADGDVNLNARVDFAQNVKVIVLVKGDLNINNEIHLQSQKNSYVSWHTTEDITVASSVVSPSNVSRTANLEGWFSAGKNFNTGTGARLNIEGAVVVNASGDGGTFNQQRDLAGGNASCPAFFIKERPDLILNSPQFVQTTRRIWQEVAP